MLLKLNLGQLNTKPVILTKLYEATRFTENRPLLSSNGDTIYFCNGKQFESQMEDIILQYFDAKQSLIQSYRYLEIC